MSVTVTARAAAFLLFFMFAYHGSRNNSGRYGNDGVTDEHDDGREETAGRGNGSDVPIAYCGHRDNGPVDAVGNVIELRVGHISFNHIHDRSHGSDKNEHEKEKDGNLGSTDPQGAQKKIAFVDECKEFEDTEHPDEPERTDHQQIVGAVKEKAQVDGKCGQQVDDAEETENVLAGLLQAINACQIFYGEEKREDIFRDPQGQISRMGKYVHAFQNDEQYAERNASDQNDVKKFPFRGIRFEYDGIDSLFQVFVVQELMPFSAPFGKIVHDVSMLDNDGTKLAIN